MMKVVPAFFFVMCIMNLPQQHSGEKASSRIHWWNWKGLFLSNPDLCQARCTRKHGYFWASDKDQVPRYAAIGTVRLKGLKCWCEVPQDLLDAIEATYGPKMAKRYKRMNKLGLTEWARRDMKDLAATSQETVFPVFISQAVSLDQFLKKMELPQAAAGAVAQMERTNSRLHEHSLSKNGSFSDRKQEVPASAYPGNESPKRQQVVSTSSGSLSPKRQQSGSEQTKLGRSASRSGNMSPTSAAVAMAIQRMDATNKLHGNDVGRLVTATGSPAATAAELLNQQQREQGHYR